MTYAQIHNRFREVDGEHYDAQQEYAQLLFAGLELPEWALIRRFKAFKKAKIFRDSHKKCCEWANEKD